MKYGLPREEKPKKKWKTAIENELRSLKMEVCFLKDQLDEATNKLTELSSSKQSAPSTFMQGFPRNKNPFLKFSQNGNSNFLQMNEPLPPFTTAFNVNSHQRKANFTGGLESPQGNPFAAVGTERPRYESTWDYDPVTRKAIRYHSITCMPSYNDIKSFEELRYEDYVLKGIGFSNQIQRYKDSKLRSSRAERNNLSFSPKSCKPLERKDAAGSSNHQFAIRPWYLTSKLPNAPWPFGRPPGSKKSSNSPDNVSSGASDMSKESNLEGEKSKYQPCFSLQRNTEMQNCSGVNTKNSSDVGVSTKDETMSSEVLMELRKIGGQISIINDRLSKMDSNLSDISSRVSVMDSRLSAVDMFVTMQRFDKKWQGLETRLADLETPPPAKPTSLPNNDSISKDTTSKGITPREGIILKEKIDDDEPITNPKTHEFDKCVDKTPLSSIKNEAESLSAMDTTDMNLTDFVRSISCTDITIGSKGLCTSSISIDSTMSNSPSKIKMENAPIEMADLNSVHSLPFESAFVENSGTHDNVFKISSSGSLSSSSSKIGDCNEGKEKNTKSEEKTPNHVAIMDNETNKLRKENKLVHEPELQMNSPDRDNNTLSDPLGVTDPKDSSFSKLGDLTMREIENDADSDFVIIEKSDVEESLEENTNSKTISLPLNETPCSSEFKMYSDITEYLEINLGKKKNLVYEFGFEAKPDFLLESEGSPVNEEKLNATQESKAAMSFEDDSFQKFKTNFIENKSVVTKQSSPFVFCDSKSSEKPPGKTG